MGKYTAIAIAKMKKRGAYCDGDNLYLQISPTGNKAWVFRYKFRGIAHRMGLGPVKAVTLSEARAKAYECNKLLASGCDPIKSKKDKNAELALAQTTSLSFKECAKTYINSHKEGWRNPKHIQQWENTLTDYVYPILGNLFVSEIDVSHIMKVMEQNRKSFSGGENFWKARAETANRVRGRIEAVLDWATVRGYRSKENPARWRGNLEMLLPKQQRAKKVEHHPALPYKAISTFMDTLKHQEGSAVEALKLIIYTAARTREVVESRWTEIDLSENLWTIPANRIKAGREHRIPLSPPAVSILKKLRKSAVGDFVFPGRDVTKPMSNMALLALLRRMNRTDITVHGFRSCFRDWVAEQTNYPREVAEAALAHVLKDKTEAAYQRGDLLEKRRKMMTAWALYCSSPN